MNNLSAFENPPADHAKRIFSFPTLFIINILLILFVFPSCSNHQKTDDENERDKMLSNKVKKMTEFTTSVYSGIDQKEYISSVVFFDNKGCLSRETKYAPDGSTESSTTCEYDLNGNRIVTKGSIADSSAYKETRSYDGDNNRIELIHFLSVNTYKYRNIASYDKEGRMIGLDWYWPSGLCEKRKYSYENDTKIKEEAFSPTGDLLYSWAYKYDKNNNLIEAVQHNANNSVLSKILYVYGNYNLLAKKTFYAGESVQNSQTYEYNKHGLLVGKADYNPYGKIYAKYRYEYEFFQ